MELDPPNRNSFRANREPESNDVGIVSAELLANMDAYWRAANYL
jgi:phosphoketolase